MNKIAIWEKQLQDAEEHYGMLQNQLKNTFNKDISSEMRELRKETTDLKIRIEHSKSHSDDDSSVKVVKNVRHDF